MNKIIFDDILNYLETKQQSLGLFTTFKVDILGEEDNALTIRSTPSAPGSRFYNGARDDQIQFQILVRHLNQSTALQVINNIAIELEKMVLPNTASYQFIDCSIYLYPTLVEKNDRGAYLYSALFQATINQK
jgi:hypothetical protein